MLYVSSTLTRDPHLKTYIVPASLHWTTMLTFSLAVRGCVSTCGAHHPIMIWWWWGCLPLYNMLCHFIPDSSLVFHKLLLVNQPYWLFYCQVGNNRRCHNWVVSYRFLLCATYLSHMMTRMVIQSICLVTTYLASRFLLCSLDNLHDYMLYWYRDNM